MASSFGRQHTRSRTRPITGGQWPVRFYSTRSPADVLLSSAALPKLSGRLSQVRAYSQSTPGACIVKWFFECARPACIPLAPLAPGRSAWD